MSDLYMMVDFGGDGSLTEDDGYLYRRLGDWWDEGEQRYDPKLGYYKSIATGNVFHLFTHRFRKVA